MPSRHAQAAALRRSKLPGVLPPAELAELPELPQEPTEYKWRNPINERDYDRDTWELFYTTPEQSITVVQVSRVDGDLFRLWGRGQTGRHGFDIVGAKDAFAVAVSMIRPRTLSTDPVPPTS